MIIEIRPKKSNSDYIANFYLPNMYLVDESGNEKSLSPTSLLFQSTIQSLPLSVRKQVFDMIHKQKEEAKAWKRAKVSELGYNFTVSGDR